MIDRLRPGALLWTLAGLIGATLLMLIAGTGVALLPLFIPLVVLVTVLFELRVPYRWAAAIGAVLAVDLFAVLLVLEPPCLAPLLRKLPDQTFELSCAEYQNLAPVALAVGVGSSAIGLLVWALAAGRFSRGATNYDGRDDTHTD